MNVNGFKVAGDDQVHKYRYPALADIPDNVGNGAFFAVYNVTTEAEVTAAVNAGRPVIMLYHNLMDNSYEVFYLTKQAAFGPSGSAWLFTSANSNGRNTNLRFTWVSDIYWNPVSTLEIPLAAEIGTLLVTVTSSGSESETTYTADKTYAEIKAALEAGRNVMVAYGYGRYNLVFWSDDDLTPFMLFSRTHVDIVETIYIDAQGNVQWQETILQTR